MGPSASFLPVCPSLSLPLLFLSLSFPSFSRARAATACLSTHRPGEALIKDNSCNGVISDDRGVLQAELLISIWKSESLRSAVPLLARHAAFIPLARCRVSLSHTEHAVKLDARGARTRDEGDWTWRRENAEPRSPSAAAPTARKGVANRSENTEPEIAARPERRVPAFASRSRDQRLFRNSRFDATRLRRCTCRRYRAVDARLHALRSLKIFVSPNDDAIGATRFNFRILQLFVFALIPESGRGRREEGSGC